MFWAFSPSERRPAMDGHGQTRTDTDKLEPPHVGCYIENAF